MSENAGAAAGCIVLAAVALAGFVIGLVASVVL